MRPCRCGHDAAVHEHYRSTRDCSACGCQGFAPPRSPHSPIAVVILALARELRIRLRRTR